MTTGGVGHMCSWILGVTMQQQIAMKKKEDDLQGTVLGVSAKNREGVQNQALLHRVAPPSGIR
jgi:hypothetical protein